MSDCRDGLATGGAAARGGSCDGRCRSAGRHPACGSTVDGSGGRPSHHPLRHPDDGGTRPRPRPGHAPSTRPGRGRPDGCWPGRLSTGSTRPPAWRCATWARRGHSGRRSWQVAQQQPGRWPRTDWAESLGGGGGNRTRARGFAGPCLNHSATPPWGGHDTAGPSAARWGPPARRRHNGDVRVTAKVDYAVRATIVLAAQGRERAEPREGGPHRGGPGHPGEVHGGDPLRPPPSRPGTQPARRRRRLLARPPGGRDQRGRCHPGRGGPDRQRSGGTPRSGRLPRGRGAAPGGMDCHPRRAAVGPRGDHAGRCGPRRASLRS